MRESPSSMGAHVLTVGLAVAAAVLAVWLDVRADGARPRSLERRVAHAIVAWLALEVASSVVVRLAQPEAATAQRMAVILLVLLPGLLYVFLASLWLLRSLTELAGAARH